MSAEPELELFRGPPDLAALEYLWSRPPTLSTELVLKLASVALERHGGLAVLRQSFDSASLDEAAS